MKSIKNILAFTFLIFVFFISGCGSHHGDDKSVADKQLDKLNFVWKSSGVTLDGAAKDTYTNFKLTFSGVQGSKVFGFAAEGRPSLSPWPLSGTFTFDDGAPQTKLLRDDKLPVTYELTETTLTMRFTYAVAGFQGRVDAVKGQWEFKFVKQ